MERHIEIRLPWPGSANSQWRVAGRGIKLTKAARAYRANVYAAVVEQEIKAIQENVAFSLRAFPPDLRDRDLDNLFKPTLDAIQAAGVLPNDRQAKELSATWGQLDRPRGHVGVILRPLDESGVGTLEDQPPLKSMLHAVEHLRDLDAEIARPWCPADRRADAVAAMQNHLRRCRCAVDSLAAELEAGYPNPYGDP